MITNMIHSGLILLQRVGFRLGYRCPRKSKSTQQTSESTLRGGAPLLLLGMSISSPTSSIVFFLLRRRTVPVHRQHRLRTLSAISLACAALLQEQRRKEATTDMALNMQSAALNPTYAAISNISSGNRYKIKAM